MFKRVMVANRGEIAYRIIKSLKKLNIKTVALYSWPDKDMPYLEEADECVCIGPAQAKDSYLNEDAILQAALNTDCEAIHPGFGFLSENARFATRCNDLKIKFIGPSAHHINIMGNKALARKTVADLGIPILKGFDDPIANASMAKDIAKDIGYPILLKARSGGGGKGMRLVKNEEELLNSFNDAKREALASFNDDALYMEKFVKNARHIEFQVLGDSFGKVICLYERECSIQRKNQKLIEEAPANGFSDEQRKEIATMICNALEKSGYENAGTMEFLLDSEKNLYFMEMNTRLQVEHPITELITGIDIVEWQVRIAANEPLTIDNKDIKLNGSAIECRINAEDPQNDFQPSPGLITNVKFPKNSLNGPIRIDTHIDTNFRVTPFYDSMLAKVIVHESNRENALQLMKRALDETHIEGVSTTIDFHKRILESEPFKNGTYDCSFITNFNKR